MVQWSAVACIESTVQPTSATPQMREHPVSQVGATPEELTEHVLSCKHTKAFMKGKVKLISCVSNELRDFSWIIDHALRAMGMKIWHGPAPRGLHARRLAAKLVEIGVSGI